MRYNAKNGDSPSKIASKYGVPFDRLISANPHKPTKVVNNVRTWQGLTHRETIIVPFGVGERLGASGYLGDIWTDAIKPLVDAGGPCLQQNVGLVCAAQRALGVSPDGKWGNDSAAAAKGISGAPPACVPRPAWWAPKGQSNCTATQSVAPRPAAAPSSVSSLTMAANAARAALAADPGYCTSVKKVGSPVNTAIHNFKSAWNSANPSNPVPIGTGNYEQSVANALSSVIGETAPPGCGATAAAPAASTSVSPASAPAAVQMLLGINPCDPANAAAVCAAQRALGVSPDGKYGADTATAARRVAPQAPAGCSPRPSWWAPKGSSNCGGAAPATTPAKTTAATTTTPTGSAPAAVQALVGIDPCLQANSGIVYAAQSALGILADGKYGPGTSAAARALGVNAPAGCSPPPLWWGAKGTAQAATATQTAKVAAAKTPSGGGASTTDQAKAATAAANAQANDAAAKAQAASTPAQADQAATAAKAAEDAAAKAAAQATTQAQADAAAAAAKVAADAAAAAAAKGGTPSGGGGDGTTVVVPEKKGLSTGAIVAGAIGAAALVGIVALAATGKKGHRGARGPRGRKPSHKHGGHKKSHKKKRK